MTPLEETGPCVHPTAEVSPLARVGEGTRIWHQAQVREGAVVGRDCVLGKGVYVDRDVVIGDRVKLQNGVFVYRGVVLEDDVFVGPGATFTNDRYPRASSPGWQPVPTRVCRGASIGANATIVCGVTVGEHALVGAGAVVTRDVPPRALVVGNPARVVGTVGEDGRPLRGAGAAVAVRPGRLRVAVVGVGNMGRNHARVLASLGGEAVLAAVADVDEAARDEAARRYGVPAAADPRQVLPLADAVVVAVPTSAHVEVALACLEAGRHVLLEKPLAPTASEAEKVARAAAARRLVLLPGHVERFNPAVVELGRALASAGRIIAFHARRLSPFGERSADTDVVADLMLHDLDLALWFLGRRVGARAGGGDAAAAEPFPPGAAGVGEAAACQGCGVAVRSAALDYAAATVVFRSGCLATFLASRVSQDKVRQIEVTAEGAYLHLDLLDRRLTVTRAATARQEGGVYRQECRTERVSVPNAEPLALELAHFARCCLGRERPLVSPEEAVAALRLVEEVRRACSLTLSQAGT